MMKTNELSGKIVDAAFQVHTTLGPGLLESVYEAVLARELTRRCLHVKRQFRVPIRYEDMVFDEGFRADLIVENRIVLELKSIEQLAPVHFKQTLTYCRLLDYRLGLLINFGAPLIRDGIKRIINGTIED
ncbi:MAG: GxxExxY protein [Pirellulaceae bacterium]